MVRFRRVSSRYRGVIRILRWENENFSRDSPSGRVQKVRFRNGEMAQRGFQEIFGNSTLVNGDFSGASPSGRDRKVRFRKENDAKGISGAT